LDQILTLSRRAEKLQKAEYLWFFLGAVQPRKNRRPRRTPTAVSFIVAAEGSFHLLPFCLSLLHDLR